MKLKSRGQVCRIVYSTAVAVVAILVPFATIIAPPHFVFATPDDATLDDFYRNGIYYYDPSGCDPSDVPSATSSKPSGDQITWIGDSYSVGAQGIIQSKLTGVDITAQSSKHFQLDVEGNESGMTILKQKKDSDDLRKYVVFALGTNDESDTKLDDAIKTIMDDYLSKDQTLILVTPYTKKSKYTKVNEQFEKAAEKYNNIILADWRKAAKDHLDEYFGDDGIHPNTKGYKVWVDTIYNALPGGVGTVSGDNNEERTWNYFATANIPGVSDNAAVIAGIMGNLKQESGFNPFSHTGGTSYYGIYQTSDSKFIQEVEAKFGSRWGTQPADDIAGEVIAFELNWLTQKNERWLGTGWASKFGFVNHLTNVKSNTPGAYSDLFLMAVEGAVTSITSAENALEDPGVIALGAGSFSSNAGGGKYFQEAKKRRTFAQEIFDKYAKNAVKTASTLRDPEFTSPVNYNQIASTAPIKKHTVQVADTTGSSQISSTVTHLDDERKKFVKDHYEVAQKLSIAYGIPWETVMAQGIVESNSGKSQIAQDKHNYFGIGAYDSCPYECAKKYANELEGWKGYYENIRKTPTYRNHGVFSGNTITDPMAYLVAIKAAGYATDPNYISTISSIILGIQEYADANGWKSSEELAKQHPEMIENAKKYAAGAGAAPTNLGEAANVCVGGDGAISNYDGSGFPWYDQCDPEWEKTPFGSCGNTCDSGCGPSSFAMMVTAITGKEITPKMTTKVAGDKGQHACGEGSYWTLTGVLADYYGLQHKDLKSSSASQAIEKINEALRDGWMIHTSGRGSNPFTSGGHYIGIRGITEDGKWLLADSAGSRGKENTLSKSFPPEEVINAGMAIDNITAIKAK